VSENGKDTRPLTVDKYPFLKELGIEAENQGCLRNGKWTSEKGSNKYFTALNPHNNEPIAHIKLASLEDYEESIELMLQEQKRWMMLPPPVRGEVVREIGNAVREKKEALGALISLEMGKIKSEGLGEV